MNNQNICRLSRAFIPLIFFHCFILILLTLASARTFLNRQERHIDELFDGSTEPISILLLPRIEKKPIIKLKNELLASYEGNEGMYESEEEEDDEQKVYKRDVEEKTNDDGTKTSSERPRSYSELFTRMRSICAKMPRLKRKRTPKPGSAESLIAFLCSSTHIFRRR